MKSLGIDCGSTSCKAVIVEDDRVVAMSNRPINTDPLQSVQDVLSSLEIHETPIHAVGVTGSSRDLIRKCIGHGFTRSEVVAHAYGTICSNTAVSTIIEIGGQDSKFMRIHDGVLSDFRINTVCGAGTGAFLESQARRMGLTMEQFDLLASSSTSALRMNGRCSIFIESAVINYQRLGASKADIAAAICHALARNYLDEIGTVDAIEPPVVLQGGVARLQSVKRSFESLLDAGVSVPDNCEYQGAYGVAMLGLHENRNTTIEPITLDGSVRRFVSELSECSDCDRSCEITKFTDPNDGSFFYVGGACNKR